MDITGNTRVYLILGDPVTQVRAPEVFNHLFRQHGIDAVLVPAEVPPGDFAAFARAAFSARNIHGLWLAIPHKPAMMDLLDRCEPAGQVAGAVNAARRNPDGSLEGALFDGLGFVKALDHFGVAYAGRKVLITGIGGGGVAIAASLAQRGVGALSLFDTTPGRAAAVADRLRANFGTKTTTPASPDPSGHDLIVNATPLGLQATDPLPFDVDRIDPGAAVIDILMKNQPTPLLRACQARGITAHPGYEMLVQQMPEYLAFFGYPALAGAVMADASEIRGILGCGPARLG